MFDFSIQENDKINSLENDTKNINTSLLEETNKKFENLVKLLDRFPGKDKNFKYKIRGFYPNECRIEKYPYNKLFRMGEYIFAYDDIGMWTNNIHIYIIVKKFLGIRVKKIFTGTVYYDNFLNPKQYFTIYVNYDYIYDLENIFNEIKECLFNKKNKELKEAIQHEAFAKLMMEKVNI